MLKLVKSPTHQDIVHAGDVLEGRYRLQRVIGEGGMGTVFLAEHVLIQRKVAIKVLHTELARDAEVVERFMNEARAAGTLGHPNIIESTDMGFARGDVPYIVFEFLEGSMLSDEVYRLRGLSPRRALKIAHQIASALQAAHRAGIVHRDLKSDNIFLTDKDDSLDHVKVLDFGISRFLEADSDLTGRGGRRAQIMGTPEFLAPEQITAPETVDARTDIYALGVVLYEMLAARTPFVNEKPDDPHELLHRILLERPPALTRDLPAGLAEAITGKLLAKSPDARYQSMGDVIAALDGFIAIVRRDSMPSIDPPNVPAEALQPVAPAVPPLAPALPAIAKRRRNWLWLIPALLAGGAGAALWWIAEPETTQGTPDFAAVQQDADQLGATLDGIVTAAQLRADGVATSPMLRAAIETDAATLADMARDGAVFDPKPGEVLEVFQLHDGAAVSLLRVSASETALVAGKEPLLTGSDQALRLIVSVPIKRPNNTVGGSLSLSVPVDAKALAPRIAEHAVAAKLAGNGIGVPLAGPGEGVERTLPVRAKLGGLSLVAMVGAPVTVAPPDLVPAYACFGAAGLFLLLFVVGLVTRR
jgi:tRNA A-37 threonylcarbamoyl transferase component Bud32